MTAQQKKTLIWVGLGLCAAVIVAVLVYAMTGSVEGAGTGAAAVAAAAEAARRRNTSKKDVEESKKDVVETAAKVEGIHEEAIEAMEAEEEQVAKMDDTEKVEDGNDLFGG